MENPAATNNPPSQGYDYPQGYPQGYQPQSYPQPQPQGYPPQNYPPQGYPQNYSPQGYPPQNYPPQGMPLQYPQGNSPQVQIVLQQPLVANPPKPQNQCLRNPITWFYCVCFAIEITGVILLSVGGSKCPSGCNNTRCWATNYYTYDCTCNDGYCRNKVVDVGLMAAGGCLLAVGIVSIICLTVYRRRYMRRY